MLIMLQKFTQKTTYNYNQFNHLGNLYAEKGQNRPRITQEPTSYKQSRPAHPSTYTEQEKESELQTPDIKKPAEAGFFYSAESRIN